MKILRYKFTLTVLLFSCAIVNIFFYSSLPTITYAQAETCKTNLIICNEQDTISENGSDENQQVIAYFMIITGVTILLINWRISTIENI
jgi:hypothetical protein